jgi:hypothetical protein
LERQAEPQAGVTVVDAESTAVARRWPSENYRRVKFGII